MTTIVDQIQDVYRISPKEWTFADTDDAIQRSSGGEFIRPDARFFKLTLASGEVKAIHCNHYRIAPRGVLAPAEWLGPDEPDFTFRVTQIYAAGAWLSLEEDKEGLQAWNKECNQRIAVEAASYEKQQYEAQGGRLS